MIWAANSIFKHILENNICPEHPLHPQLKAPNYKIAGNIMFLLLFHDCH
ncbi:hypothetical protein OHAE_709 [Ochrobactrum soli]|uniref:Uncharacterized protein n=1 Tax=Ochrobactrum soli TaxID=2448455 RepID=A0A2P9HL86_9HYPH|nr:hypothetical protein OHAE_709 [[Ochrobactrum] soli]